MPSLRLLSALVLLLLAASDGRRMLEPVNRINRYRSRTETAAGTEHGVKPLEREKRSHQGMDGDKDPRYKEKFIQHLTGPLSFHPKCRKQFNRIYHSTRDCTTPAYYRRCAVLLVRLANSPECAVKSVVPTVSDGQVAVTKRKRRHPKAHAVPGIRQHIQRSPAPSNKRC
ncbi:ALK and LTK ligand 1-like [Betta splendens]|uniref:ALK and LTK ligand 1-like n=1 Tax=Betta splendens TaxID=158456 RepID=A0A6P7LWB4_BETSP|nr:ALK and LTK ligand 1-like [Betta splendens]XP_055362930.1 ALK and LTK ligand 1-like [Betta splendens]